jgi:hypothetical protein
MRRKHYENTAPKSSKVDLIEGILIGSQQTKASKRLHEEDTPELMIKKLNKIVEVSSCDMTKVRAQQVIDLLTPMSPKISVAEYIRKQMYEQTLNDVNSVKKVMA